MHISVKCVVIENDDEFAKEELWLHDCQNLFLKVDVAAKSYTENVELKGLSQAVEKEAEVLQASGMIGMQSGNRGSETELSNMNQNASQNATIVDSSSESASDNPIDSVRNNVIPSQSIEPVANNQASNSVIANQREELAGAESGTVYNAKSCRFQMEKPKLPKFSGDVREYAIFKVDFKEAIESRYSKQYSITLLRTC
jgi:hypothetical protein